MQSTKEENSHSRESFRSPLFCLFYYTPTAVCVHVELIIIKREKAMLVSLKFHMQAMWICGMKCAVATLGSIKAGRKKKNFKRLQCGDYKVTYALLNIFTPALAYVYESCGSSEGLKTHLLTRYVFFSLSYSTLWTFHACIMPFEKLLNNSR